MKRSAKLVQLLLEILTAALLIGSFPVRSAFGPLPCDLMRIAGFVLLFVCLGMNFWTAENSRK